MRAHKTREQNARTRAHHRALLRALLHARFTRATRANACRYARTTGATLRHVMPLDDGEYDCVVTDVARDNDGVVVIDIAVASGDAKGNVVRLRASMPNEPIHWLGLPGRLKVVDGAPSFRLDSA